MKLSALASRGTYRIIGSPAAEISGVSYDSRNVKPGDLFVALAGRHTDGAGFIDAAVAAGAAAVMAGREVPGLAVPQIVADDPLAAMAEISAEVYSHPDKRLLLVGVTGTNGKTTITYFLESLFAAAGKPAGIMGTVNYRYGTTVYPAPNTTPQSADIYRFFDELERAGRPVAVMEVSSHALSLGRVAGLEFDIAIFTNLTRDHLDFHKDMESYFAAKARLFTGLAGGVKTFGKCAIINFDDPYGRQLAGLSAGARVVSYAIDADAAVRAENIRMSGKGTEFLMTTEHGRRKVCLNHLGRHNVYNALAAAAAALSAGIPLETVVAGLEKAGYVPGRLEKVDEGQPYTVVVDFAHTDDALRNVLTALRALSPARLITVFGCGGDRDRSKRPLMGEVATELSDFVFVTSDNPRSEDAQRITLDIEVGIRRKDRSNYRVIVNREEAIAAAIAMARKGDIIILAGKGHETYQIIGDKKLHFSDSETAAKHIRLALEKKSRAEASPQQEFDL